MPLLKDHIAVVTGAGSGIGRAIAPGYAREGARVVLLDVNEQAAAEAAKEIRDAGGKAESFRLDVTKREDCIAIAKEIAAKVGQVSILVQQCRHQPPQRLHRRSRCRAEGLAGHHGDQPQRRVQRHPRFPRAAARHQGPHRQYRLDPVLRACAHAELAGLYHLQARRARLHQGARRRARQARRARQRHRPRPDRDAAQRAGARQQSGAGEDLPGPHPARPRRQAGGHRRPRDLPRLRPCRPMSPARS